MQCVFLIAWALTLFMCSSVTGQTPGYDLWMNYKQIDNEKLNQSYQKATTSLAVLGKSETIQAIKNELQLALPQLLEKQPEIKSVVEERSNLIIASLDALPSNIKKKFSAAVDNLGDEGFIIKSIKIEKNTKLVVTAYTEIGLLYGTFRLLALMQQHKDLTKVNLTDSPKIDIRMLNHWDNLDRTVERGYAGFSLWNWQKLPEYIDQRYLDYARANASIGINAVSLTNVNANALILTPMYLEKVKALAETFRPYGIKVYLTARFSAPIEIGGLETADPLHQKVIEWWQAKADEIYDLIPDFGGFLVKANSEGQPGPQNYDRNHVDGANMMAKALAPHQW